MALQYSFTRCMSLTGFGDPKWYTNGFRGLKNKWYTNGVQIVFKLFMWSDHGRGKSPDHLNTILVPCLLENPKAIFILFWVSKPCKGHAPRNPRPKIGKHTDCFFLHFCNIGLEFMIVCIFGWIFGFWVHVRDRGVLRGSAYSYMLN